MPIDSEKKVLKEKLGKLRNNLVNLPSAVLAFSGGVDSTFLLAVAKEVIQGRLIAVNAACEFVPERETAAAGDIANQIGAELVSFQTDVMSNTDVTKNSPQRCYFCKKQIFSSIRQMARAQGIKHLLHGVNLDDLDDYRPGLKAAEELGFLSPLADAGLTKKDIRKLSRQMGLSTWNKPSQSCLATRVAYHDEITVQKLQMIEKAEQVMHALGFEQVRVRHMGETAKIEVEAEYVNRILEPDIRRKVSEAFEKIGFNKISIDEEGYKTGKMNQEILKP